jgi:hypothetical protein
MFLGGLTMFVSCVSMFLRLFVVTILMVVRRLMVMMGGRMMVSSRLMVMITCRMLGRLCHFTDLLDFRCRR